jgi:hypothetical protein
MNNVVHGRWSGEHLTDQEERAKPVALPRGIANDGGASHVPAMETPSRSEIEAQIAAS